MKTLETAFTSGYCCLNSTAIPRSLLSAGYAVVSTEMLADQLVHSPNRGACYPIGSATPFSLIDLGDLL